MFGGLKERPLDERRQVSIRIREKYPDRIPVIVDRPSPSSRKRDTTPPIDKHKYLVPADLIMGKFVHEVRRHIKITPEQSLFFFINGTLLPNDELISRIYEKHRDSDGFLYVIYTTENTFGK